MLRKALMGICPLSSCLESGVRHRNVPDPFAGTISRDGLIQTARRETHPIP